MSEYQLTHYSHAAGCGCKIEPSVLHDILSIEKEKATHGFEQLLVGNESHDDAAVWDLGNGQALISTVDFFMPVVDDAYDFGRVAAANALSDIYAMGGRPIFANAILGWPVQKLPAELAARVMEGARSICHQAGIPIAGGHSIDSPEPIFGLAVNGLAATGHIKQNNSAQSGDLIFLTKPIGTGILSTALKRGMVRDTTHVETVIKSMCSLNAAGADFGTLQAVHAMTDVTGFALLGHLIEMTQGSGLSAEINFSRIPYFDFLDEYLAQNAIPDNTYRNWNAIEKKVDGLDDMKAFQVLNDPQTSGGLLLAVAADGVEELKQVLRAHGLQDFLQPIGKFVNKATFDVRIS